MATAITSMKLTVKFVAETSSQSELKATRRCANVEQAGYLGKALSVLLVNRAVRKNIIQSLKNLKEISELKEIPPG